MKVFFYGLFMDEEVLASQGIIPGEVCRGYVEGYALRIGERATLVRNPAGRVYGVTMDVSKDDIAGLYAQASVADYVPEQVVVELLDGRRIDATVYNLPEDRVTGANREYALSLLEVATRLEFPNSYLAIIRQAGL